MSGHNIAQPAYEGIQGLSRDLVGTGRPPNKTVAEAPLSQDFENDQDGPENHEGDL